MGNAAVVLVVIVLLAVVAGAVFVTRARTRRRLRARFGVEYDRALQRHDSPKEAEEELLDRERRVDELAIRPLDPAARDRYRSEWARVQERFVDDPRPAVGAANRLVSAVMRDRGYPEEADHERRIEYLSVEHARAIDGYRAAHDVETRAEEDDVTTEDLRRAMVGYRVLFHDLLGGSTAEVPPAPKEAADDRIP